MLVIGVVVLAATARAAHQRSRRQALAWVISLAAERGVPLPAAVRSVAGSFWGGNRKRAGALAERIEGGAALPEAVADARDLFTDDIRLAIAMGWHAGTLPESLRLALGAQQRRVRMWQPVLNRLAYVLVVLLAVQSGFVFLTVFVLPKLQRITQDFGIALPNVTILVNETIGRVFVGPVLGVLVCIAVLVALAILGSVGATNSRLAPVRRWLFRHDRGTILRSLAVEVARGRTLTDAVSSLSQLHPDRSLQRRLSRVHEAASAGGDVWEAFHAAGLLRPGERALLHAAERAGNLPWGLRAVAEAVDRRLFHRLELLAAFLGPLVVLALGLLVALFVIAYFMPLLKILMQIGGGT
jgi:general secretion pathway protein F